MEKSSSSLPKPKLTQWAEEEQENLVKRSKSSRDDNKEDDLNQTNYITPPSAKLQRAYKLDPADVRLLRLTSDALHLTLEQFECLSASKQRPLSDILNHQVVTEFINAGGKTPQAREVFKRARGGRTTPIQNDKQYPRGAILTPAARSLGFFSREAINRACEEGLIMRVLAPAYEAPYIPETAEERTLRKLRQREDFAEAEKIRGKLPEDLSLEMRQEAEIWQEHLTYILYRKRQLTTIPEEIEEDAEFEDEEEEERITETDSNFGGELKGRKLRKEEIEDSFYKYVANQLTLLEVNGYHVYFSTKSLDLKRENLNKITNLDLMSYGKCPIGADGKVMNFHHLTHFDYVTHKTLSVIVLLSEAFHKSAGLHFGKNTYRDKPRIRIKRDKFGEARTEFCKQIAQYFSTLPK